MQKIGIFGGTFNPVHNAHLLIAEYFQKQCRLEKLLFVPAFRSPFKIGDKLTVSDSERVDMLRLAIEENPYYEIEPYEIIRPEISYTIDTLKYLREQYLKVEFYLLIGADQTEYFHKWKDWKQILQSVVLCVAGRDNAASLFSDEVIDFLEINHLKTEYINSPFIDISSTFIRENIYVLSKIHELIPAKVLEYIREKGLYIHENTTT